MEALADNDLMRVRMKSKKSPYKELDRRKEGMKWNEIKAGMNEE